MTASPRNRIKVKLPADVSVAHKSGQMPGTRNDVGLISAGDTTIAIAIFTRVGKKSTDDERAEVISDIARRVFDELR